MFTKRPRKPTDSADPAEPAPGRANVPARLGAFDRAIRLLDLRPHFRREVEQKLQRAGYESGEVKDAVERLAALGYLDDTANARAFAATLAGRKGFGAARVRQELMRRGASREAIDAVLTESRAESGQDAELERARAAAEKWTRRSSAGDGAALARHLARRGFDRRVIFSVLKELARDGEGESFAD